MPIMRIDRLRLSGWLIGLAVAALVLTGARMPAGRPVPPATVALDTTASGETGIVVVGGSRPLELSAGARPRAQLRLIDRTGARTRVRILARTADRAGARLVTAAVSRHGRTLFRGSLADLSTRHLSVGVVPAGARAHVSVAFSASGSAAVAAAGRRLVVDVEVATEAA